MSKAKDAEGENMMNKRIAMVVTLISLGVPVAQTALQWMGQVDGLGAVQSGALALMVMGLLIPTQPKSHA